MEEDLILLDEDSNVFQEEEFIQDQESYVSSSEILQIVPEEINLSDPFFLGVQVSGVMCMLSLGIAVVLRMFRKA